MANKAKIAEIFTSIQGEGSYIGVKQLFIRFCGCNLNCNFCDTNGISDENYLEFTADELKKHLDNFNLRIIHSISLTGGEPLLWADFLIEFLPIIKNKIYLETNSTLNNNLEKIINFVDIISADIKLPSASGIQNSFAVHDEFFKTARKYDKEIFAKIVFDKNILEDEINHCLKLAEKYNLELILQPKTEEENIAVSPETILEVLDKFLSQHPKTRLIPQVHKYLGVE
ncbi:MAG: 7-carboxy-7-deazaguanine synthase QueE [Candidatus Gastranaerophilales bacterium]|nr:7-carboxy-7-deazaguanine synthase QueE [Candidatus Gastranaerophilales bacterium]